MPTYCRCVQHADASLMSTMIIARRQLLILSVSLDSYLYSSQLLLVEYISAIADNNLLTRRMYIDSVHYEPSQALFGIPV